MRRRLRDGLAVTAFAAMIVGCLASVWAFAAMFASMAAAALIDPESSHGRAAAYRAQQRSAALLQPAGEPGRPLLRVHGHPLECGCVEIPEQTFLCPADAALAEIEDMWAGHD